MILREKSSQSLDSPQTLRDDQSVKRRLYAEPELFIPIASKEQRRVKLFEKNLQVCLNKPGAP